MTLLLGIDPGETIGWCLYDTDDRRVNAFADYPCEDALGAGVVEFFKQHAGRWVQVVIERPKVYGGIARPDVGETCVQFGRLFEMFRQNGSTPCCPTRIEIRKALTDATQGVINVRNDATAWQALKVLHGGDKADKKGGKLHGFLGKGHAKAALAVAVAWDLMHPAEKSATSA